MPPVLLSTTPQWGYSPAYQAPSFWKKNLSYNIPSVAFPFNLTMKALDQMLFPKMSLCKVFMPGKNSSERPPALLVPSQLVRRTVLATASGNTWALPLTVLLVPTVHL